MLVERTRLPVVSASPPGSWQNLCEQQHRLFGSADWQDLLRRSFGSSTLYLFYPQSNDGAAISVFRAGPFSIGYWEFPAPVTLQKQQFASRDWLPDAIAALSNSPLAHLRLTISAFTQPCTLPYRHSRLPETAITDLGQWSEDVLGSSTRRNIRTAQRHLRLVEADSREQAVTMYQLYCHTIKRHAGVVRYTPEYFQNLVAYSQHSPTIRCLLAIHDDNIAGYIVVALDGRTAYYLHGATQTPLQHYRPSDMLFSETIHWAQKSGMEEFNFMASPMDQPSLVRYKEKWGGVTAYQTVYEVPIRAFRSSVFLQLAKIQRHLVKRTKLKTPWLVIK